MVVGRTLAAALCRHSHPKLESVQARGSASTTVTLSGATVDWAATRDRRRASIYASDSFPIGHRMHNNW